MRPKVNFKIDYKAANLAAAVEMIKGGKLVKDVANTISLLGRAALRDALAALPHDTGRLRNSWALAGNGAGLGPFRVLPLQPSRQSARQAQLLAARLAIAKSRVEHLMRRGRATYKTNRVGQRGTSTPDFAMAKNDSAEIEKAIVQARAGVVFAREQLAKFAAGSFRAANSGQKVGGAGTALLFTRRSAGRVRVSVISDTFGGVGSLRVRGQLVDLSMRSLEPHARIVESKTRVIALTVARLQSLGLPAIATGVGKNISAVLERGAFR